MTAFSVRGAGPHDLDAWVGLRHLLWPHLSIDGHRAEVLAALSEPDRLVSFLCLDPDGTAVGLAEASIRSDYVNGCETSPVAFLEGIVVHPLAQRQGLARLLISAVSDWALARGFSELASDAEMDNIISHAMHTALGFEETQRVVYFRKIL